MGSINKCQAHCVLKNHGQQGTLPSWSKDLSLVHFLSQCSWFKMLGQGLTFPNNPCHIAWWLRRVKNALFRGLSLNVMCLAGFNRETILKWKFKTNRMVSVEAIRNVFKRKTLFPFVRTLLISLAELIWFIFVR